MRNPTIPAALHNLADRLQEFGDPDTANTVLDLAHEYTSGRLGQPQVLDELNRLLDAYEPVHQ